jgi:GGDEF domain-containing protein
MIRHTTRILLVGDERHEMEGPLRQAVGGAAITPVANYFDAIAELGSGAYSDVVASVEPIERRPEAAIRTLRQLVVNGKLVLFGYPALEAISRKMLAFGCDDYVITPVKAEELQLLFGAPAMRIAPAAEEESPTPTTQDLPLEHFPLAEIALDALLEHPANPLSACLAQLNRRAGSEMRIHYQARTSAGYTLPAAPKGGSLLWQAVRVGDEEVGQLYLFLNEPAEAVQTQVPARQFLARLAQLAARLHALSDQHKRLQKLAITDELTGVFNRRYFKHFLTTIIERARVKKFWVTVLLFDIDNFKRYNDQFGHSVGDEILRETAALMKRCVREHDLVSRIGGDEFAVVFWDKEGPRLPKEADKSQPPLPARPPQEPQQIFERFQRLIASRDFPGLGPSGQGTLTISGGLASYPWDGRDMAELIRHADDALMFKAKKQGKNTIVLVGRDKLQ